MTEGSQPALVLDGPVAQSEAVHFAGFPGLWLEDRPIAVSELGFVDLDAAVARVEELGLPLAATTVAEGEGLMPEVPNHVRAGELAVFDADGLADTVEEPAPVNEFELAVAANADPLIESLADVQELAQLDGLEQAETAGKNRTTVLQAIAARRAELTPDDGEGQA